MNNVLVTSKANLFRLLQCEICLESVQDARLCPQCSRFFCDKCIHGWITTRSSSCPSCRAVLRYDTLVKGCSINEMQESITLLVSSLEKHYPEAATANNYCERHEKLQVNLFCYSCEMNVCANCWFSEDHADHKERVVPLDEAYEHYRQNMRMALAWVDGRMQLIDQGLSKVTKNQLQLSRERENIEKLRKKSVALVAGEASPATLINIVNIERRITELRSTQYQPETETIRIEHRRNFMLESTVLIFRRTEFHKTIQGKDSYESNAKGPHGFVWKCTITTVDPEGEGDDGDAEDDDILSCLTLIEGKPSEYSVTFENEPERVQRFELNKPVRIGQFDPARHVDNDTQQVTVRIRQTYADRIQQLQAHIARLEQECADQKSYNKPLLSDCEKSMEPSAS
ncbi:tripartite motif-containing protein 54-like [Ochlerotatus camptorhynchus]|uniref:tripartite motif-containing protein 54-like n=1 Tax=Ochlerotatus camptorhynchus TaxID=644619 RepID=UPI0031E2A5D6